MVVDVGLLKEGLTTFRQRGGQNEASGSSSTAAVADGRSCVKPQVGSKMGFFNSPDAPMLLRIYCGFILTSGGPQRMVI